MEIGRFGCSACIDQHLCRLSAVRFDADTVDTVVETGEHLAADFPAIQLGRGVRRGSAFVRFAHRVDLGSVHSGMLLQIVMRVK